MALHVAEFLVSGTWVRPARVDSIVFFIVGGGQGGHGGNVVQPNFTAGAGGGGGLIGENVGLHDIDQNILVTIGAGGAGGVGAGGVGSGGSTSLTLGARTVSTAGGNSGSVGQTLTVSTGFPTGGGGGGTYAETLAHIGIVLAGNPAASAVSKSQTSGKSSRTSGADALTEIFGLGGKGRQGFGGGGTGGRLPSDYTIAQTGARATDGGGLGGEWSNGSTGENGGHGVPNTGGGGGGAVSYGSSRNGGNGGSGYAMIAWWGPPSVTANQTNSLNPRRLVRVESNVVVDCIEALDLEPWMSLGWINVSPQALLGILVSVDWTWNGSNFVPPP
jgi:hypothetical protein